MRLTIVLMLCVLLENSFADSGQKPVEISAAALGEHMLTRVEPVYPPIAKAARLQGKVVVKVEITREGAVTNVKVISGHPFLIQSALDAVRQWKYKPFIVEDQLVAVAAVIEIPFSLGIPDSDYEKQEQIAQIYFKQEDKCRDLVRKNQFSEAEAVCKLAVNTADKLPVSRRMERVTAYQFAGHATFYQKRFSDALAYYRQELAIAEASLTADNAELGYAYRDVAHGLHGSGDLKQARTYYEKAEKVLQQAREHIESDFLKNEYSKIIQRTLQEYAVLLRQTGDTDAAEAADKKASTIVIKTGLKD